MAHEVVSGYLRRCYDCSRSKRKARDVRFTSTHIQKLLGGCE